MLTPFRSSSLTPTLAMVLALTPVAALADWLPNGTPIVAYRSLPEAAFTAVTDDASGVIVSWGQLLLFASRLTEMGDFPPGWPAGGIRLRQADWAYYPLAVADGRGGAFVVFNAKDCPAHCALNPTELRVQRVNADGSIAHGWDPIGIRVGSGFGPDPARSRDYGNTVAISDARGGVVVVWSSRVNRDGHGPVELRAQRIDGSGMLHWGDTGVLVRSTTFHAFMQTAVPDGKGGAILFWLDERSPGLFAQHLSRSGQSSWATNGVPIPQENFASFSRPVAIEDGSRGAIVAWVGATASDSGIFAARVTHGGGRPWREPTRVLDAASGIDSLRMVPARGGAIIAWRDSRTTAGAIISAQRISRNGSTQWRRAGVPVCTVPGHKDYLAVAPDGRDGAYIAWGDTRPAGEVFATHLDGNGEPAPGWPRNGSPVCAQMANVSAVQLVPSGSDGAIVVWTDDRGSLGDRFTHYTIQAMRLLPHGVATPPLAHQYAPGVEREAKPLRQWRSASPGFALHGIQPNPGGGRGLIHFSLPSAASATLEVFDAAGRRLWSREVGHLGVGEHAVRIDDGVQITPGVYLVRLVQDDRVATARIAVIR